MSDTPQWLEDVKTQIEKQINIAEMKLLDLYDRCYAADGERYEGNEKLKACWDAVQEMIDELDSYEWEEGVANATVENQ